MKLSLRHISWLFFLFLIYLTSAADLSAETLFRGRQIYLNNDRYSVFRIGVTGTTAGYNYLALIEGAKQESIALGELGYWESEY